MTRNWRNILTNQEQDSILWGGEPAGALLTDNLRPQEFIIYSNIELSETAKRMRWLPDKTGKVEVRQKFRKNNNNNQNIVPALLIYIDLMNSGYGRNVEIASQILKNELQHIQ